MREERKSLNRRHIGEKKAFNYNEIRGAAFAHQ